MNAAASLARNRIGPAMSSGSSTWGSGVERSRAMISSSERCWRGMAVFAEPGQMALTRMPSGPSSIASVLVKPITAHLEAAYGERLG